MEEKRKDLDRNGSIRKRRWKSEVQFETQRLHFFGKNNPSYKHGETKTPFYRLWRGMRQRCEDPKHDHYRYYGARGIKVCERWHVYLNFKKDMWPRPTPNHTIDRVDNNKGYCPENCKWSTKMEQANNRGKVNRWITWNGKTQTAAMWQRELGLSKQGFLRRLRKWPLERAMDPKSGVGNNQFSKDYELRVPKRIQSWLDRNGFQIIRK